MSERNAGAMFRDLFAPAVERFRALVERVRFRDELLLALVVVAMTLPFLGIRSYHFEEGLTAALARDTFSSSPWYVPELFGSRWIERPVLQSWIIAVISWPLGEVSQYSARLPTLMTLFLGATLVFRLLRPRVSRAAALFGALCFLFSPAVLQKAVTAEADMMLTVFEFGAFYVWWKGYETSRLSLRRWTAVGLLLAATALCKGPQPAAFFAFGVGAFILVKRDWRQIPGYVLAGVISLGLMMSWYLAVYRESDVQTLLIYMRLERYETLWDYLHDRLDFAAIVLTFLPGLFVIAAAWLSRARGTESDVAVSDRSLFLALALYALILIPPLAFWQGTETRYASPALPAVAAMAGLAFDRLAARRGELAGFAVTILAALMIYQLVWVWIVAPLAPDAFRETRRDARIIEGVVKTDPHPVFAPLRIADGVLVYLDRPVRYVERGNEAVITAPSYFLSDKRRLDLFAAARPDLQFLPRATIDFDDLVLYELRPR